MRALLALRVFFVRIQRRRRNHALKVPIAAVMLLSVRFVKAVNSRAKSPRRVVQSAKQATNAKRVLSRRLPVLVMANTLLQEANLVFRAPRVTIALLRHRTKYISAQTELMPSAVDLHAYHVKLDTTVLTQTPQPVFNAALALTP